MKKRGVIELHFNWIFVLIAGAIIFAFFITIVNKQREFSEIKSSGTIITNLDSILTGAQVSTNTVNLISMPKVDIGFDCNRYFIGPVPKQTKGNVIFAPDLLKGREIITWALDWALPYSVTNFLYITDPQVRYIIVNNSKDLGQEIFDELPKEMNKELIHKNQLNYLKDKNNYKVKFIFLENITTNDGLSTFNNMFDKDVTAIGFPELKDSDIITNTGKIIFYQKNNNEWKEQISEGMTETFYLKKESLFGAIFTADSEMYNCVMKKAFKKLNLVSRIYSNRSSELGDYYNKLNNFGCASAHSNAANQINKIITDSSKLSENFPESDITTINNIKTSAYNTESGIWAHNRNAQLFSCALIY